MTKDKETNDYESAIIEKNKEATLVRRIVLITIFVLIIIISIGVYSIYSYVESALKPVDPNNKEDVHFEIPIGTSTAQIGEILEENGLIKDKRIFRYYLKFRDGANFQAGNYALSPSLSLKDIIKELQTGKVIIDPFYTITIPEGKTVEQISEIMANKLSFDSEEFLEVANDKKYIQSLIEKYPNILSEDVLQPDLYFPLEGYLFAGTYEIFEEEPSIESIIDMMIERTNSIYNSNVDEIEHSDFTMHEILTFASVIERESKFSEDRPKVAQVYMNRLEENMKLQSDITALYGLDHKVVMTYDDVNVESPYNTYVIDGLPIGPINSPSLEAIEAVLHPEGEEFTKIYYFSRPNGETFYSDTLDEHNQIIDEYRHEWYDLEDESNSDEESNDE